MARNPGQGTLSGQDIKRRLSAILAADIVGYTRLMEVDEDGTLAAWRGARADIIEPAIARHHGRIVKLTGDGFLAEFAAVSDAVVCAVALQTALDAGTLAFRMGINLGDVVEEAGDIYGEGVNIAARLEALAEPGGICLSAGVYDQVKNRVEETFTDLGERQLKHVAHPVRVYALNIDKPADAENSPAPSRADSDKPSVAVLPFDNLSGDKEQEYFSDGMAEDIITALSRLRGFSVTARNSSFAYKGKSPDIRTVAKELGVRYVLEGSVRKAGNRVRITAQLIDGQSGNHIWAERYDRELDDIFELQDEITLTVVGALEPELGRAERERARHKATDNLAAW
jgi:adenylate cyclase